MALEYLSGNALKKYPFSDVANRTSTTGYIFSDDIILDLLIQSFIGGTNTVTLRRFIIHTGTSQVRITFDVSRPGEGIIPVTHTAIFSFASIVANQLTSFANSTFNVKIISGKGLVALVDAAIDIDELFDPAGLPLAPSAVLQPVPRVTSLSFYNEDDLLITFNSDLNAETEVVLQEGTNTNFTNIGKTASLAVNAKSGAGLYDNCPEDDNIKAINGIPPDSNFNFIFDTDGCYTMTKAASNHGLEIENTCTPKCTEEQLKAYARYVNRVNDGLTSLSGIASSAAQDLADLIEDYSANVAPNKNKPYARLAFSKFQQEGNVFISVVVGFFNPTTDPKTISCTLSFPGTYVTDTARYHTAHDTVLLTSPSPYTNTVPCLSVSRLEFVFVGTTGTLAASGSIGGVSFSLTESIT